MASERGSDSYAGLSYRDLIDWPRRLARESPFLERELARAPDRSALDVGCGTGEHARHLASLGYRVVGVDRSPAMLEKAREKEDPPQLTFVEGDFVRLEDSLRDRFGGAVCLGNSLPHLETEEDLRAAFRGIASRLLAGGVFIGQALNYERIFSQQIRHLPLNILPSADGTIVFLRLMDLEPGGFVRFCPSVLRWRPDRNPPVEMIESRLVRLRGWREPEVSSALRSAGFEEIRLFGDMTGGAFDAASSGDLVFVARRGRGAAGPIDPPHGAA